MNLAIKDIRYSFGRFLLTAAGVGFLITASIGMIGLYRGIVADALLLIEHIGADLWVVQGGHSGPLFGKLGHFARHGSTSGGCCRRCFRASLHPDQPAGELKRQERARHYHGNRLSVRHRQLA